MIAAAFRPREHAICPSMPIVFATRCGTTAARRQILASSIGKSSIVRPPWTVLLHANLVDIEMDPSGQEVVAYRIASLEGKSAKVRARQFVLALGGLENPRLLLNATSVQTRGVGNDRDLVGRFFMEHLNTGAGEVISGEDDWAPAYDSLFRDDRQYRAFLMASPREQEKTEHSRKRRRPRPTLPGPRTLDSL